jgi:hypothetical protein
VIHPSPVYNVKEYVADALDLVLRRVSIQDGDNRRKRRVGGMTAVHHGKADSEQTLLAVIEINANL